MAALAEDTDEEIWLREMLIARFHVDTGQTMSLFTPKCVVYAYLDAKLGMVGSVRSRAQHWDTPVQNMIASMLTDSPRFELDCPITYAIDPNRPRNTRYRKCRAFRYIAPKSLTGVPPAFRAKFKAVFQDNDASIASRVRERAVVNRPVQPCIADQQPEPPSPQHGNEGEEAVRHSGDEWWESGDEDSGHRIVYGGGSGEERAEGQSGGTEARTVGDEYGDGGQGNVEGTQDPTMCCMLRLPFWDRGSWVGTVKGNAQENASQVDTGTNSRRSSKVTGLEGRVTSLLHTRPQSKRNARGIRPLR